MYSKVAKTKRHFAEDFALSKLNFICSWFFKSVYHGLQVPASIRKKKRKQ